jgi:hypothetical protein
MGGGYVVAQRTFALPGASVIVRQPAVSSPSVSAATSPSVLAAPTASATSSVATSTLQSAPQLKGLPTGWRLVDAIVLPVRIAVPDGWQVEVTSSEINILLEHKPETQT